MTVMDKDHPEACNHIVWDLDADKQIENCTWVNTETGEYKVRVYSQETNDIEEISLQGNVDLLRIV